jgi:hypothetical protein
MREFVACDVLSRLQRVMEDPRFLLGGECVPLRAGDRFRVYATRGPYICIYPHDTPVLALLHLIEFRKRVHAMRRQLELPAHRQTSVLRPVRQLFERQGAVRTPLWPG